MTVKRTYEFRKEGNKVYVQEARGYASWDEIRNPWIYYTGSGKLGEVYIPEDFFDGVVSVYGDTYPVKDFLKSKGFKWNPLEKCWQREVSPSVYQDAERKEKLDILKNSLSFHLALGRKSEMEIIEMKKKEGFPEELIWEALKIVKKKEERK